MKELNKVEYIADIEWIKLNYSVGCHLRIQWLLNSSWDKRNFLDKSAKNGPYGFGQKMFFGASVIQF